MFCARKLLCLKIVLGRRPDIAVNINRKRSEVLEVDVRIARSIELDFVRHDVASTPKTPSPLVGRAEEGVTTTRINET
jgi:hypothetical protein